VGAIEPQHFHLYLQPRGDSRLRSGVQEFVVKVFLLKVSHTQAPQEQNRHPTWFSVDEARSALAMGRDPRYAAELGTVIDRAVERLCAEDRIAADSSKVSAPHRIWRSLVRSLRLDFLK
jgi:hypothetical protein